MGSAASKRDIDSSGPVEHKATATDPDAEKPAGTFTAGYPLPTSPPAVTATTTTTTLPSDPHDDPQLLSSPRESNSSRSSVKEMARFESISLEPLTPRTPRKPCRKDDSGRSEGPHVSFTGAVVLVEEPCGDESLRSPFLSFRPALGAQSLGSDSVVTSASFDSVVVGLTSPQTKHRHQLATPIRARAEDVWKRDC